MGHSSASKSEGIRERVGARWSECVLKRVAICDQPRVDCVTNARVGVAVVCDQPRVDFVTNARVGVAVVYWMNLCCSIVPCV